jgi:hypothetical protein
VALTKKADVGQEFTGNDVARIPVLHQPGALCKRIGKRQAHKLNE